MSWFKKRIYLDYASATPVRREVRRAMEEYVSESFYNPSSIYEEGRAVRRAVEEARTRVARIVHAGAKDIVFTSGGTESDNLAILGAYESAHETLPRPHIIITEHEHPAILEAAREAERRGAELSVVPIAEVVAHIKGSTALISLSMCSSETGELRPVSKIGRAVRAVRKERGSQYPYLHVDASQAVITQHINVDTLGADLLTLDGAKIYGPKGVGALVVRPWAHIRPILLGGGQERGLRSGTENVSSVAGFAEALALADAERASEAARMKELREHCVLAMGREIPEAVVNGEDAVPNIVSITIPGKLHELLAIALEEKGILVSTGSSCSSSKDEADKEALRLSFGRDTRESDVRAAVRALKEILI